MSPRALLGLLLTIPVADVSAEPTSFLNALLSPGGSGTNNGGVFLRGTEARIQSTIFKCVENTPGCPFNFDRNSLYYRLPPGITYVSHQASNPIAPVTCTTGAAPDGGQYVACTGGSVVGWSWAAYKQATLLLNVNVATDAPLGAARVVMAVDDSLPDQSATLAECLDDIFPNYCDEFTGSIDVAPAPDLHIVQMSHTPMVFQPDDTSARIELFVRNEGNAPSTGTHVQVSLPAGFQWQLANTTVIGLTMTCSASGTWNDGQTVTCTGGPLAVPNSANASTVTLRLGIRPRGSMEYPGPLPVVASVNDGTAADPAVLLACAADPSPAHCAWHEVPTWVPCAYAYADGIFCDGFQPPDEVQVHPARLDTDA